MIARVSFFFRGGRNRNLAQPLSLDLREFQCGRLFFSGSGVDAVCSRSRHSGYLLERDRVTTGSLRCVHRRCPDITQVRRAPDRSRELLVSAGTSSSPRKRTQGLSPAPGSVLPRIEGMSPRRSPSPRGPALSPGRRRTTRLDLVVEHAQSCFSAVMGCSWGLR